MKLDRKDRFIIANQLKILEALYPDEASSYAIHRTAFEEGYENHYDWAMENISKDVLTEDDAQEVVDTLDMYRAIRRAYNSLADKTGIKEYAVKFAGYDGNDPVEGELLGYARYFVVELERFQEVLESHGDHFDFNSHGKRRKSYKQMLAKWLPIPSGVESGSKHNLTKEQLIEVLEAANWKRS